MNKSFFIFNVFLILTSHKLNSTVYIKSNIDKLLSVQKCETNIKRKAESDGVAEKIIDSIFGIAIGGYKLLSENSSKETQQQGAISALENAKELFHTIAEDTSPKRNSQKSIKQVLQEVENVLESILQNEKAISILRMRVKLMLNSVN
jgi:hypothetical protein